MHRPDGDVKKVVVLESGVVIVKIQESLEKTGAVVPSEGVGGSIRRSKRHHAVSIAIGDGPLLNKRKFNEWRTDQKFGKKRDSREVRTAD